MMYIKYHFELRKRINSLTVETVCGTVTCNSDNQAVDLCAAIARERNKQLSLVYKMEPKPFTEVYRDSNKTVV